MEITLYQGFSLYTPGFRVIAEAANNHVWISCPNSSARQSCWPSFFVRPGGVSYDTVFTTPQTIRLALYFGSGARPGRHLLVRWPARVLLALAATLEYCDGGTFYRPRVGDRLYLSPKSCILILFIFQPVPHYFTPPISSPGPALLPTRLRNGTLV